MKAENTSHVLAIIPARGGSKGIPHKNISLLAGKPLLAHSIIHARQSPSVTRIVVSTDDKEIARVAQEWQAEVVWRPREISGDTASSESALIHTLEHLKATENYVPNLIVFLQATSPLRSPNDIEAAIRTLQREYAESLFSACVRHGFFWCKTSEGVHPINYDPLCRPQRQDLKESYLEENGSLYVLKPWVLQRFKSRLGGKVAVHLMDPLDSFQIDAPADIELTERILASRANRVVTPNLSVVRLLVLDFDGVLTDNRVLVDEDGKEAVWCHRGDSLGLATLRQSGIVVLVLSKERNAVVGARCRKLGVHCVRGCDDKLTVLKEFASAHEIHASEVAYVGNDVNDLDCMRWVGMPIAVADATEAVRRQAMWITLERGGRGAVREVAEWVLQGVGMQKLARVCPSDLRAMSGTGRQSAA